MMRIGVPHARTRLRGVWDEQETSSWHGDSDRLDCLPVLFRIRYSLPVYPCVSA